MRGDSSNGCFSVSFGVFSGVDSGVRLSGQESSLGANNGILDGCNGVLVFEGVRIVRLIDADALKASYIVLSTTTNSPCHLYVSIEDINSAPTIDAEPVVHGRWTYFNWGGKSRYRCSECLHWVIAGTDRNHCPNCGAKMDGEAQDG